jgi:puromycin-sensitive aminopeptidase
MRPRFLDFTFTGEETIYLNILKPVKEIILHAVDLDISDVKIGGMKAAKIAFDKKNETVTFSFNKLLPKGKAELFLKFSGELTDKLKGFYRSRYEVDGPASAKATAGKQEKFLATTQFESTDARRAFPCFDEPAHKAVFDVSLEIPGHMTAVSNTIETAVTEHNSGYKTVQFAPSPKMSTYLLAFIVGELEFVETKSKRGVVVRVFITQGKKLQAKLALETAARALDFYEDYFNIPYPLPVLDLIAIPDFASAAMENWGAITYRESALLYDDKQSSASHKQWVAIVIAHEIAHQWFGNLVTMEWWTDLWLNEGFASYMEYLCVDALFPEWQMWNQYVAERLAVALRLDALKTSHPIEIEVHHPGEISEIFDQISYAKGSVVLRMLAEYLGAKDFRDGLRHYLKKHAYGNTVTADLWKSLEVVSKKPVQKMMAAWTGQTGYPLIEVEEKNNKLILTQSRFFSSEISRKQNKGKTIWPVPLDGLIVNKSKLILPRGDKKVVKFNSGETSLARIKYPLEKINQLMPAVATKELPASDRLGIIRDAFALAESGQFSTVDALKIAEYYKDETELPVWEVIASGLHTAGDFYQGESWYKNYQEYCRNLFLPLAKILGWQKNPGESHLQGLLRSLVLMEAGSYGDDPTITQAQKLFKSGKIEPDLRGVVYNLVAQNGNQKDFQKLVSMYKAAGQHHEEQDRIGRALGSFKNGKILAQVLGFAMSKQVRQQDAAFIFNSVARTFYGRASAWKYLKNNWKIIDQNYNVGGHLLEWFVAPFARFQSTADAKDYSQFFKTHRAPNVARAIEQTLERIYSNAAWIKREKKNIEQWLKNR